LELEGLERVDLKVGFFGTFGRDSRSRSLIQWSAAGGVAVGIPLWNNTELMIARQWTWNKYEGGLVGIGQPGEVVTQRVTSTTLVLGTGNAPGMPMYPFNSRTPPLFELPYNSALILSWNYVRENDGSQKVPAVGFRTGNVTGIFYNDFLDGLIPRLVASLSGRKMMVRDERETGGFGLSVRCQSCPGISTISFGTEVRTDRPMYMINEEGEVEEATYTDIWNGKRYYDVLSPQNTAGLWYLRGSGQASNGVTWTLGSHLVGKAGMAAQNGLHDLIKNPRFYSPHRSGFGLEGGLGIR